MTTSQSSTRLLRMQSDRIAAILKRASRGESTPMDPGGRATDVDPVKVGILMDDKVITVTITWAKIRETSEQDLSEFIFDYTSGQRQGRPQ